jgi:hypothetical protein
VEEPEAFRKVGMKAGSILAFVLWGRVSMESCCCDGVAEIRTHSPLLAYPGSASLMLGPTPAGEPLRSMPARASPLSCMRSYASAAS